MRTWLRASFAVLIGLGLAAQALRVGRLDGAGDPVATLIGRLAMLHVEASESPRAHVLLGRSPLCDRPVEVALLPIDGADDAAMRLPDDPDSVVRYVYLGTVGEHRGGTALLGRWLWFSALFHAGLRAAPPPGRLVELALPRACPVLRTLDWATLSP